MTGLASTAGSFSERMHVRATMGSVTKDVIKTDFHAECTPPLLETSSQRLTFTYAWTEGSILAPMEETLRIKNITELPLYMSMRTLPPFTVDRLDVTLGPGEEDELLVEFDPGFRTDRQTTVISGKLQISYADCPHKDQIDLVGEINFPNLKLQAETLDFGCVLTDTIERRYFTITNVSSVPAAYEWALAAQYEEEQRERKSGPPLAPPGEVFDVLPTQGLLEPGASERIEVSYFARPGAHSMCWAVCNVTGGPSYEVRVSAESSHIRYTVDKHLVDIGRQQYNRASEQEVVINNTGRVPFNYVVNLSKLSRPSIVSASPAQGTIGPGHRDAIRLRVTPGIPDRIAEEIVLEIAHCEPEVIRVVGEGTFQGLVLSLPRMDESTFRAVKDAAREHLAAHGPRLHPADMAALVGSKQGQGTAKGRAGTSGAPQTARLTATGGRVSTIGAGDAEGAALARGRSGFIGGGYEPTALEVDIEADRRSLCRLLMERLAGGASDTLVLEPSAKSMASAGSAPRKPSVIVAHYLLDLGHITKGTSKSRKFRLQNTAPTQISLSIDRRTLQASGMTIEPEKLAKLAEYGTANFTLTMDTAMVPTGAAQCIVPVEIKGGPSVLVTIKSNVVIPELTLSRELLDFGPVQAGHCKVNIIFDS